MAKHHPIITDRCHKQSICHHFHVRVHKSEPDCQNESHQLSVQKAHFKVSSRSLPTKVGSVALRGLQGVKCLRNLMAFLSFLFCFFTYKTLVKVKRCFEVHDLKRTKVHLLTNGANAMLRCLPGRMLL